MMSNELTKEEQNLIKQLERLAPFTTREQDIIYLMAKFISPEIVPALKIPDHEKILDEKIEKFKEKHGI